MRIGRRVDDMDDTEFEPVSGRCECGAMSGPSVERRRTGEQFVPAGAVDDPLADIGEAVLEIRS